MGVCVGVGVCVSVSVGVWGWTCGVCRGLTLTYVYVPAFGCFFAKFSIAIGELSSVTKEPEFIIGTF